MYTLLFLLGLLIGGSLGYLVSALINIVDKEDDDDSL